MTIHLIFDLRNWAHQHFVKTGFAFFQPVYSLERLNDQ